MAWRASAASPEGSCGSSTPMARIFGPVTAELSRTSSCSPNGPSAHCLRRRPADTELCDQSDLINGLVVRDSPPQGTEGQPGAAKAGHHASARELLGCAPEVTLADVCCARSAGSPATSMRVAAGLGDIGTDASPRARQSDGTGFTAWFHDWPRQASTFLTEDSGWSRGWPRRQPTRAPEVLIQPLRVGCLERGTLSCGSRRSIRSGD